VPFAIDNYVLMNSEGLGSIAMKPVICLFLLFASVLLAQTTKSPGHQQQLSGSQPSFPGGTGSVTPAASIITITGFCSNEEFKPRPVARERTCRRAITRKEFDDLINVVNPKMSDANRRQLGDAYPNLLIEAREAVRLGLDKDHRVQQIMHLVRMRVLARELELRLQQQGSQVSDAEVEKYYRDHAREFEEFTLRRIYIPRVKQAADGSSASLPVGDSQMKIEADQIQRRALAGGDFDVLQREVFKFAGMVAPPPNTDIGKRSRSGLPREQSGVFDLSVGGVSQVISDPAGYYIYKVQARTIPPVSAFAPVLRKQLVQKNVTALREGLLHGAKIHLNSAYFKPLEQYVAFGGPVGAGEEEAAARAAARTNQRSTKPTKGEQ
jgi:hypothetical protein